MGDEDAGGAGGLDGAGGAGGVCRRDIGKWYIPKILLWEIYRIHKEFFAQNKT